MVEFQAGDITAVQHPATKIRNSTLPGPAQPARPRTVSSAVATACAPSAPSISRLRSVVSLSTPAGKTSRNIGRKTAVCTSAARKDEPVSSTIIHAAAVDCMKLAMKYSVPPPSNVRKARWRSGARMERERRMGRPIFTRHRTACPGHGNHRRVGAGIGTGLRRAARGGGRSWGRNPGQAQIHARAGSGYAQGI